MRMLSTTLCPGWIRPVDQVIDRHGVAVLVDPNGVLHAEQDLQDLTGEVTERLNAL